jgi:hypothetical protein
VEKFELIATTGKNAKMPALPLFQSFKHPSFISFLILILK